VARKERLGEQAVADLDLGGFDVVVHLAESVINQGLELLPSGSTFPVQERKNVTLTAADVPLPIGNQDVPLVYDAFVELERPQVDLDQATGRVIVTCDLSPASQLTFLRPASAADAALITGVVQQIPIRGSVQLDCPFVVDSWSGVWGGQAVSGRAAIARATGVAATLALVVPSADGSGNVPLATAVNGGSAVQVTVAQIEAALQAAGVVGTNTGDAIGDLPLTTPVRLNAGPTPVQTVRNVFARISPSTSPPALSLGVLTAIEPLSPGGAIPAPPAELGAAGAIIWVSNYWTLHLLCSALRAAHPGMTFTINQSPPSASFRGSVVVEGGEEPIKVRELDIAVNPNGGLAVTGFATASGGCWDADIDFDFTFTFTCDPNTGTVLPTASAPNVDVDVDKDWLCQVIGAVIGAIGGFITGAIIGALISGNWVGAVVGGVVGAIVGGVAGWAAAGYLIDPLDLDGVSLDSVSVLAGLTLPLPIGGAGMLVESCDFDDLAVAGYVVYVDLAERHRSGSLELSAGTGFDLDGGLVRPNLTADDDIADVLWTGTVVSTVSGATLGPVFASDANAFGTLSLTDLERFEYAAGSIAFMGLAVTGLRQAMPAAAEMARADRAARRAAREALGAAFDLPARGPRSSPWVSFALRTDEGRYAKCRARRNWSGGLTLEYVVYARPRACLGTVMTLETLSRTVVESGVDICTDVRTEEATATGGGGGVFLPALPTLRVLADVQRELARVTESGVFERADLLRSFPPKRPRTSACGTHVTVEHEQADWQLVDRQQRATIQALPAGVVAPLEYRWNVFGTDLPTGSGTTTVGHVVASYDQNSPILALTAPEGEDVAGSITVNATDADGRKLRATRQINSPSRKRLGGCCPKEPAKLTLEEAVWHLEQTRTAQRIYSAAVARLLQVASSGRVPQIEETTISAAIEGVASRKDRGIGEAE
jgi:outer membrane lipoprotein SlyB